MNDVCDHWRSLLVQKSSAFEAFGSNKEYPKEERSTAGACKLAHKISLENINFILGYVADQKGFRGY